MAADLVIHLGDICKEPPEHPNYAASRREARARIDQPGLTPHYVAGNMDIGDKPDPTMWTPPVSESSLARQALDIYHIDLARNGFTEAAYLRQRVEEIGARLCNHCYKTPISVAACLHWLSTCRDAFLFEDCVDDSTLRHELTEERLIADPDGWITVPDRPGLDVTLSESFIANDLHAESGA